EVHACFEERLVQAFIIFHFNFFLTVNKIITTTRLTFRELEATTCFTLTKLLTLYRTWVTRQQVFLLQRIVILLGIFLHQSTGDTQLDSLCLPFRTTTSYCYRYVIAACRFCNQQ